MYIYFFFKATNLRRMLKKKQDNAQFKETKRDNKMAFVNR